MCSTPRLQELVPLNAGNIITGGEDRAVAAAWVALINRSLNKVQAPTAGLHGPRISRHRHLNWCHPQAGDASDHYVVIMQRQLVGVYLAVFVHRRLLPQVRGTQVFPPLSLLRLPSA